jgi:NAD+ diphosphatase
MSGSGQLAPAPALGDGWVVLGAADTVLVAEDDPARFVHSDLVPPDGAAPIPVGDDHGRRTWAVATVSETPPVPATRFIPAWELISRLGARDFAVLSRARMLATWQRDHRFCGRCGTPTAVASDEHAVVCGGCGLRSYPRISPVIIVRVMRGDEILLARPRRAGRALYSVLAGFVEAGEALEDTVVREIAEEVGVAVADIAYFGSQPWPFPHALMVAFTAQWTRGEITPDVGEIVDAGWYRAGALPEIPPRGSIARALIDDFLAGGAPA